MKNSNSLFQFLLIGICSMMSIISCYAQKNNTLTFKEYGFSISAPCEWQAVTKGPNDKFVINYAGIVNENNPAKLVFYQIIVNRLPVGYKDVPKDKLDAWLDTELRKVVSGFESFKPIRFGYESYKGYATTGHHNGYKQRGVMFVKDNLIIALTVISNYNLDENFNQFTNNFIVLKNNTSSVTSTSTSGTRQTLPFGYSVSTSCTLKSQPTTENDYDYIGVTDEKHPDEAFVYKVLLNKLPMKYSSMNESDRKAIYNNLYSYISAKVNYSKVSVNVSNVFAYLVKYKESGIYFNECIILTDTDVIELIIFAKKEIPNSMMTNYINSLKK